MIYEDILTFFEIKKHGEDKCQVLCPAHHDRQASLSVSRGDDGRTLLKCHAGCSLDNILAAIGLKKKDLFSDNGTLKKKIVSTYNYLDENGALVFQVCRTAPKGFFQRRPDGKNLWINNLKGITRVPFHLPELLKRRAQSSEEITVLIVEGEKDVLALEKLHFTATTNPSGAGKWLQSYSKYFKKGDRVILLPDNDSPGLLHMTDVARKLFGFVQDIRILELSGLKEKQDVSDWIKSGGTAAELTKLANDCLLYEPSAKDTDDRRELDPGALEKYDRTDYDVAHLLKESFGNDIRFVYPARRWLNWTGALWERDNKARINEYFEELTREALHLAAEKSGDTRDFIMKWVTYIKKQCYRRSALEMASTAFHELKVMDNELNSDNMLLNTLNGTLDLRTGELRSHNHKDLITRICPVKYSPGTQSRDWNDFLKVVLPDLDVRRYVQKAAGYSLTGDTSEEKLFFIYGPPATGKSTFLAAVRGVMGDYFLTADFTSFLTSRLREGGARSDIAGLKGYRFVSSIEVEDGAHLAEGLLSLLTGGDSVRARFLYNESFEFLPTFKLWLAANNQPGVSSGESALWRRLKMIPFEQTIEKPNPEVKKILSNPQKAGSAILAWLVEGCLTWQKEGLQPEPSAVKALTEQYRHESDPLREFIEDNGVVFGRGSVSKKELYEKYLEYCELQKNKYPKSQKTFNKIIFSRGGRETRANAIRVWTNINLNYKPL